MTEVSIENFNEFKTNDGVSFIKYYGTWCGPCKVLDPIVEKIENKYQNVKFGKVDIDKERNLALEYGIRSIPTMLVIKNGEIVDRLVGALPENQITETLDKHLN